MERASTDGGGNIALATRRVVNGLNQLAAVQGATGQTTSLGYDANGSPVSQTDPLAHTTRQALDGLRRPTAVTLPDNASAAQAWNALDQLTQVTDPKGVRTSYTRNAFGEVLAGSSPDIGTITYERDAAGNVVRTTDAKGQVTAITRDALGRPTAIAYADGQSVQLAYDTAGNLARMDDRSGSTVFTRDAHGRVTAKLQVVQFGASVTTQKQMAFAYAGGDLVGVTYPSGMQVTYRRQAGRIVGIDVKPRGMFSASAPFVTGLAYTALGQPRAWAWASGDQAARSFDQDGRMTGNEFASYSWDAANRLAAITQQLWMRKDDMLQQLPIAWSVGYDSRDRVTGMARDGASVQYTYDANSNRLTSAETLAGPIDLDGFLDGHPRRTQTEAQTLDIDPTSNRLLGFDRAVTVTDGNRTPSSIRLHVPYTLDANGSLTSDGQRTFDYDASGRLARTRIATLGSESQVDYNYNAMGQRVFKSQQAAQWTGPRAEELGEDFMGWLRRHFGDWMKQEPVQLGQAFVYGDGQLPVWALLGEYDNGSARGKDTTEYIWLPTEDGSAIPIGMARGSRLFAIHSDHLGTPRSMTNHEGKPVWQWPYSAFGDNEPTGVLRGRAAQGTLKVEKTEPQQELNLRMPGQYADEEAGSFYNLMRNYQAGTGRYTQSDPIGLQGGINTFAYSDGSPTTKTDPLGLATYMCIRPLSGKPGANRRYGPDIWGNPAWHQYSCVSDPDPRGVGFICGGQAPADKFLYGPGRPTNPSEDYYHPDACEKTQDDNTCFESCMVEKWNQPRPNYGWPTAGRDCKEYDNDVNAACRKKCSLK